MMHAYDTDVLIVGAGPTGLMAANGLRRLGVPCRIIERKAGPTEHSQALAVHARSLEIMDLLGIAEAFIRRGYTAPGLNLSGDSREPVDVELYRLDTRFPYILILPQGETEEILEQHLQSLGGQVERNLTLQKIHQEDDSVTAEIRGADGQEQTIQARYLIDCEGAHSVIRHELNVPAISGKYQGVAFLADVKVEGELAKGYVSNYSSERGFMLFLPFRDDYVRVIAIDFSKQHIPASTPLELSDLQESIDAIVPFQFTLREPRWITRFEAPHRVLNSYRIGRIFLAGDAAHLFIPAGGQGMNTGLQDAFNLAWKLALVCRGLAPEDLLDSYHEERHAIGLQTLRFSDQMFRFFLLQARNSLFKRVAQRIMRIVVPRPQVQNVLGRNLSQIGLQYRQTTRSRAQHVQSLPSRAKQAGDRVPDLEVASVEEPEVRLYELLRAPAYGLFVYLSPLRPQTERDRLIQLARQVQETYGELVRTSIVLEEGLPEKDIGVPVLIDVKRQFQTKLGAEHGSLLFIRPDAYVAFHTHESSEEQLTTLLATWIKAPALNKEDQKAVRLHSVESSGGAG